MTLFITKISKRVEWLKLLSKKTETIPSIRFASIFLVQLTEKMFATVKFKAVQVA